MINILKAVKGNLKKINNVNRKNYKENYYIEYLLNKEISYTQSFKRKDLNKYCETRRNKKDERNWRRI